MVAALYHDQHCRVSLAGTTFDGFTITSGIRQGCPLSPLLFAAVTDLLLRILSKRFPTLVARAFADDTAAVSADIFGNAAELLDVFRRYAAMSGLHLNLRKTVFIPLASEALEPWGERFLREHPAWQGVQINDRGTYLGFAVGPGQAGHSWDKASGKLPARA